MKGEIEMYKCLDCGLLFNEGEEVAWYERHGLDTPPYEKMCGCPKCMGAFEKTVQCSICLEDHLEDELTSGICESCLAEAASDYDTFVEFLSIDPFYPDGMSNLEEFWFGEMMDLAPWDMPRGSSKKMRANLLYAVKREIAMEKVTAGHEFKDHMRHYVNTVPTAKLDLAEFLRYKHKKGEHA